MTPVITQSSKVRLSLKLDQLSGETPTEDQLSLESSRKLVLSGKNI